MIVCQLVLSLCWCDIQAAASITSGLRRTCWIPDPMMILVDHLPRDLFNGMLFHLGQSDGGGGNHIRRRGLPDRVSTRASSSSRGGASDRHPTARSDLCIYAAGRSRRGRGVFCREVSVRAPGVADLFSAPRKYFLFLPLGLQLCHPREHVLIVSFGIKSGFHNRQSTCAPHRQWHSVTAQGPVNSSSAVATDARRNPIAVASPLFVLDGDRSAMTSPQLPRFPRSCARGGEVRHRPRRSDSTTSPIAAFRPIPSSFRSSPAVSTAFAVEPLG